MGRPSFEHPLSHRSILCRPFPIGGEPNASAFFQSYLAFPIIIAFYLFWKIYKRTRIVRAHEVDLVSGRRELNLKELKAQEREEQKNWGFFKRY